MLTYHNEYTEQKWRDEAEARERDSARNDARDMREAEPIAEVPGRILLRVGSLIPEAPRRILPQRVGSFACIGNGLYCRVGNGRKR